MQQVMSVQESDTTMLVKRSSARDKKITSILP